MCCTVGPWWLSILYMAACIALVAQSCLTLCDPMDISPSGSSVRGILQTRILEWVAMTFSRGSSYPGIQPDLLQCSQILYQLNHQCVYISPKLPKYAPITTFPSSNLGLFSKTVSVFFIPSCHYFIIQ